MIKLTDLSPTFMCWNERSLIKYRANVSFKEAQGIKFLCPFHFQKNSGEKGTHHVVLWFDLGDRSANDLSLPLRYQISGGSDFEDLTLNGELRYLNCWVGTIIKGEVNTLM